VLVADLAELGPVPELPAGVEVRAATTPDEVAAIVALQERVFGGGQAVFGRLLERALERDPPWALGVVALADGQPVSAGRVEFNEGSDFAGLWGGGTDPAWRGCGLYRATVAFRADLARDRGYRYVQVDALPTSRPILERLGFVELTRTTPYRPPTQTVPAQTAGRSL